LEIANPTIISVFLTHYYIFPNSDVDDSSNESSKFMPTKASAAGNTTAAFSTQPVNAGSTDRVFQRIKRGKLGGADPRGVLIIFFLIISAVIVLILFPNSFYRRKQHGWIRAKCLW
jgi:hypothetical protein